MEKSLRVPHTHSAARRLHTSTQRSAVVAPVVPRARPPQPAVVREGPAGEQVALVAQLAVVAPAWAVAAVAQVQLCVSGQRRRPTVVLGRAPRRQ